MTRPKLLAGLTLLFLSLVFYYLTVLRIDFGRTNFLDLGPYTDAVEYFAQAKSMLVSGRPEIRIGEDQLPSRYPPGYPALMLPWMTVLSGDQMVLAPFRTNETVGLFLLLGCLSFYLLQERPIAGGICAFLLSTQPWFTTYSRSSMSDLSGAMAAVLFIALLCLGLERRQRAWIYLSAVVLGLSLFIRLQMVFLAPGLVAMAFFPKGKRAAEWWIHCGLVLALFFISAGPYFLYNELHFGNPFKTGYDFWVPGVTRAGLPFSMRNVPTQLHLIWAEVSQRRDQFSVANLFGTGAYLTPAFIILAVWGAGYRRPWRVIVAVGAALICFFAFTVTYSFVDLRFYLPIFFVMVLLATRAVELAVAGLATGRLSLERVAILVLFGFCIAGFPSQSGWPPKSGRAQSLDALRFAVTGGRSPIYQVVERFKALTKARPGLVLSNIDPVYLNALLPSGFSSAPLDGHHSYSYSEQWHFGQANAEKFARDGVDRGVPVYSIFSQKQPGAADIRFPSIAGYHWSDPEVIEDGFTLRRLRREQKPGAVARPPAGGNGG